MSAIDERFARAYPRLRTAAVTGTNGKTTTTSMIAAIVAASGEPSAALTTLGGAVGDQRFKGTTPAAEFLATVERAVAVGACTLALEVTSKALAGGIAGRWRPEVAVFTNLSRDHLDMHRSPEAYLAAKAQLFMKLLDHGVAVLNGDDPASELITQVMPRHLAIRRFSTADATADLAATTIETSARGTRVELARSRLGEALGGGLALRVTGAVHAENAMAAALAADALGYPAAAIRDGLQQFRGVTGRFQIVGEAPLVVVDYAHTPDGLEGTLTTGRRLVGEHGRLVCVFGCGGERDRGKRPQMGAIAHRLADLAVVTNDNPRREPPETIAAAIRAGAQGPGAEWREELDRRVAIESAIDQAGAADVVIIAGKGHEKVQELGGQKIPFSDLEVATAACQARGVVARGR